MIENPIFVCTEDDPISAEVMQMLLIHRLGYSEVAIFEETSNFIDKLTTLPAIPNIFFLDIHITPHNGFEVLDMLRNDKQYAGAMIVAVTASVMSEDVDAFQSAGFDGLISKPIDPDTFPALVESILKRKPMWQI